MKILLVQPLYYGANWGGAHKANRLMMEDLARRGHTCQVLAPARIWHQDPTPEPQERLRRRLAGLGSTPRVAAPERSVYTLDGVEVHAVSDGVGMVRELGRRVADFAPDWTIVSEDASFTLLEIALEATAGRTVGLAHSPSSLPFGPGSFERSARRGEILARAAGVLTVSRYMRDYLREHGGIDAAVVYFPSYGEPPFPHLARFGEGAVVMTNPSTIKGFPIYLELARRFPEIPFAAITTWGTGADERRALEELPNVELWRPFDDLDELFAKVRVLVAPSLWGEAFGQIAVDAMLRGVPVLAADHGGLREATLGVGTVVPVRPITGYGKQRNDKGLPIAEVPDQDIDPWAAALAHLLTDRAAYEEISTRSRTAALAFVDGLSFAPIIDFLAQLDAAGRVGRAETAPPPDPGDRLRDMSPEKRALLLRRLRSKGA